MPRIGRIVLPGQPHHVTQHGNNRQDVFLVDDDRTVYLHLLWRQALLYGVEVIGYCLMSNHVHLIVSPAREDSLAKAVGRTHFLYTQYLHRLHNRTGHLWQNRFYSCALDEPHCWEALCYVERNPVRAGLVRAPWRYPWSSAPAHCGLSQLPGLLSSPRWRRAWSSETWKARLQTREQEAALTALRLSTHTGRPLGTDTFLSKLEKTLGRRLRPLPIGRPKKVASEGGK